MLQLKADVDVPDLGESMLTALAVDDVWWQYQLSIMSLHPEDGSGSTLSQLLSHQKIQYNNYKYTFSQQQQKNALK